MLYHVWTTLLTPLLDPNIIGYWQVEVVKKDCESAFCTPDGLFEFNVMLVGLCSAPASFQRLMDLVLAGLQWTSCLVYFDDVIIVGRTCDETESESCIHIPERAGLKTQTQKVFSLLTSSGIPGACCASKYGSHDIKKVANWQLA